MADLISMLAAAGGAGGEVDPNFNQTVLLLHGDGTNGAQNNTFLDSGTANSGSGFTITRNPASGPNAPTQGTFSPFSAPDGRWSNYFSSGSDDYLSIPDSADVELGTNNFCIQAWIYPTSTTEETIISKWTATGTAGSNSWLLFINAGALNFITSTNGSAQDINISGGTVSANAWSHVAICRSGNDYGLFLNGTRVADTNNANALYDTATTVKIGRYSGGVFGEFDGYMSNVSIVNGSSVFDPTQTTLTVPTAPLSTSTTNQKLLTCYGNRFADFNTATTAKTITVNGTPKVTPFSPFAPTAAYSASVNGGSAYLDGTGDYLTVANNAAFQLGTGDFTVDFWYYPNDTTLVATVGLWGQSTSQVSWLVYLNASSQVVWYTSTDGSTQTASITSSASVILNQWNHIAVVNSSGTTTIYINGVTDNTVASVNLYAANSGLSIGYNPVGGTPDNVNGYLSCIRILKGTAINFASTGIPTAPPTNITNTSLLLNFTNAGIFDQTGKNNLETVADAQIDTTTKKFGTGSMEFDGTGDYLAPTSTTELVLGTGDFTIEFWLYPTSVTSTARAIISNRYTGATNDVFVCAFDDGTSTGIYFHTQSTAVMNSGVAPTANTWQHIAYVRSSGTLYIYKDGTSIGTPTAFTSNLSYAVAPFIGKDGTRSSPAANYTGFIDDLRITKGVARYTTAFTPPTKAFPDL